MKKIFLFASVAMFAVACGNTQPKEASTEEPTAATEETTEEEAPVYPYKAGAEFDVTMALNNQEFMTKWESFEGYTMPAVIKADINEACKKKGCWMNVDLGSDKDMMVKFKDYEFFVPLDAAGHVTTVSGIAFKKEISVEHLKHLAEDAGASQDSIAKITEPKEVLAFQADGVVVE